MIVENADLGFAPRTGRFARRGIAPRTLGSEPSVLLLDERAKKSLVSSLAVAVRADHVALGDLRPERLFAQAGAVVRRDREQLRAAAWDVIEVHHVGRVADAAIGARSLLRLSNDLAQLGVVVSSAPGSAGSRSARLRPGGVLFVLAGAAEGLQLVPLLLVEGGEPLPALASAAGLHDRSVAGRVLNFNARSERAAPLLC